MIGLISRLTDQKGFDLIAAAAGRLMALDATWTMLGSGEPRYEELSGARWRADHPDRVSATIGFDERLAHLIEAGADMFLMPSRFEPCGLNQMLQPALRHRADRARATAAWTTRCVDADEPGGDRASSSRLHAGCDG